jgi:uncharacterized protein (DUF1501 family)
MTRRVWLKNGALALLSLGVAPPFLARTAFAQARTRPKRLIAIFQRGAVDGLSVVVPFGDPEYYRARPSIAIAPPGAGENAAIDLDGFFGLNPRMRPLVPLWQAGQLSVVHACGSPNATRSHFDAQDYMESGTPGVKNTGDGWLNRYLQAPRPAGIPSPFRAVSMTAQLPRTLQGASPAVAMSQLDRFAIRGAQGAAGAAASFEALYASAADRLLANTARETFDALRMLTSADPSAYAPAHGADYPRGAFGQSLRQIAQLIKADVGVEVAFAELGGWDTHVNQGSAQGQLATRLDDFARSIAALTTDLGDEMENTVVLTLSEFGRAVNENGNRGTDHGHANAMFVIGGGVRGGRVLGRWPGLGPQQRFESRDLAVTTDFRDLFGEIVASHLGVGDIRPVFPGYEVQRSRFPGLFRT